jgi:hypothetical protein
MSRPKLLLYDRNVETNEKISNNYKPKIMINCHLSLSCSAKRASGGTLRPLAVTLHLRAITSSNRRLFASKGQVKHQAMTGKSRQNGHSKYQKRVYALVVFSDMANDTHVTMKRPANTHVAACQIEPTSLPTVGTWGEKETGKITTY